MKQCTKCKEVKDDNEFYPHKKGKNGLFSWCRQCVKLNAQRWRIDNAERYKSTYLAYDKSDSYHNNRLLRRYNITIDVWKDLMKNQDNRCPICKRIFDNNSKMASPCVDHDHKTGKIRSVLCYKCNLLLGHAEDDPEILLNAVKYLKGDRYNECY